MGIVPLCFKSGEDMESLDLTGHEQYTIHLPTSVHEMRPGQDIVVATNTGKAFTCILRFDTEVNEIPLLLLLFPPIPYFLFSVTHLSLRHGWQILKW